MNPWTLALLGYSCFYAIIAYAIHRSNVTIGYPPLAIVVSSIAQCTVFAGTIVYALDMQARVARTWRRLFPWLCLELCVGVLADAFVPTDFNLQTHGLVWVVNLALNLWLIAPAYYFNFNIATYGKGEKA